LIPVRIGHTNHATENKYFHVDKFSASERTRLGEWLTAEEVVGSQTFDRSRTT
jgi:hypothetical protein